MKVIVTAGPTREFLDPVRFLSNPSSGKMGFAVAAAAAQRGHDVTLIAGPVSLKTPRAVKRKDVVSAREMLQALEDELAAAQGSEETVWVISVAAVADWRPKTCADSKLKKSRMKGTLELVRNPDILKTLSLKRIKNLKLAGFAAETGNLLAEAMRKCREKRLSFIVANDVTESGAGFGVDTNKASIVFPDGISIHYPVMSKRSLARRIILQAEKL